jgi:hypothetical protein
MFANHIGADSTSLWAAVTSGNGTIGVHLPACVLARIRTDLQAISNWDESVAKRKEAQSILLSSQGYSLNFNYKHFKNSKPKV